MAILRPHAGSGSTGFALLNAGITLTASLAMMGTAAVSGVCIRGIFLPSAISQR